MTIAIAIIETPGDLDVYRTKFSRKELLEDGNFQQLRTSSWNTGSHQALSDACVSGNKLLTSIESMPFLVREIEKSVEKGTEYCVGKSTKQLDRTLESKGLYYISG